VPGGQTEQAALLALSEYVTRYAPVVARVGVSSGAGPGHGWEVVERVPTRSGGADFGAPTRVLERDYEPVSRQEAARTAALASAAWELFDEIVAGAPDSLRKGPRGGGRDRDAIVEHVVGAEQMFAQRVGIKLAVPAPVTALASRPTGAPSSSGAGPASPWRRPGRAGPPAMPPGACYGTCWTRLGDRRPVGGRRRPPPMTVAIGGLGRLVPRGSAGQ